MRITSLLRLFLILEKTKNIPSIEESDKYLNDIITGYKKNMIINKLKYEIRKNKLGQNTDRYVEKEIPKSVEELKKQVQDNSQDETSAEQVPRNKTHARLLEKLRERKLSPTSKNMLTKNEVDLKIDGQNYVALSIVRSVDPSIKRLPMKIKGAFETELECSNYVKSLIEFDDDYDIFVAKMYVWLPCIPDIEKIEQEYGNEQLNQLNKGHKNNEQVIKGFMHKQNKNMDLSSTEFLNEDVSTLLDKLEKDDPLNHRKE